MAGLLQVLRILEIVLGVCLTLSVLLASNENWGVLYLLVIFAAVNALPLLIGLWALIFRPALRRVAVWVTLLPIAFLVIPMTIRTAMGNPVNSRLLLFAGLAAVAVGLILSFARPQSIAARLPSTLFTSKAWNVSLLVLLVAGWLIGVVAAVVTGPALLDTSSGQGSPGMGGAVLLILTMAWLIVLALLSIVVAAWGWLGLRGSVEGARRKLHGAQLLLASPGLLLGFFFLFKLPALQ